MKIIVLAGGADQIALIRELKGRGHEVVLVDYFQNPPAKQYADKHIVASTLDIDAVRDIALKERADLVCTACTDFCDVGIHIKSIGNSNACHRKYKELPDCGRRTANVELTDFIYLITIWFYTGNGLDCSHLYISMLFSSKVIYVKGNDRTFCT